MMLMWAEPSDLSKVVVFRNGDKIRHRQTGETHFVEYVHISGHRLIVVTTDGIRLKSGDVINITWLDKHP